MLKRIRIPARWANNPSAVADFKLGLGPCGKVVEALFVAYDDNFVIVTQKTVCGEVKIFRYHFSQLTGRVEETY
jgi:hypothetical protein